MKKIKSLFTLQEWSYIFYDWAESVYSVIIMSAILPIVFSSLTDLANIDSIKSTAYWGYANSIGTIIIAFMSPILGSIADYRGYKKKMFMFFFIIGVFFTGLMGLIPYHTFAWFILLILFIFSLFGYTGANIFYDSFIVDVTDEKKMDKVSTTGYALGYIGGSTIPFIISILIILNANTLGLDDFMAAKISFIITALWWLVFAIPFVKYVNQVGGLEKEKHIVLLSFKRLVKTFKEITQYKQVFIFLLAYFFYIDGVNTIIKMATTYGTSLGLDSNGLMIALLVTQIVACPCAIIYGKLSEHYSTRKLISIAIFIYSFICIYAYFLDSITDFFILAILVASSQGGIQALSRSYFGKIIPKEKSNEFFGFYTIFGRFAAIMGPLLMAVTTDLTNDTNFGVLSLIALFIIGGSIFIFGTQEVK